MKMCDEPGKLMPKRRCSGEGCKRVMQGLLLEQINLCKCGGYFCHEHKYNHRCEFDYRKLQRRKVASENKKVVAPKLPHSI